MSFDINGIRNTLSLAQTPHRFEHTLGVALTAAMLGRIYGADPEKCEVAGLLHDCAKCYSDQELIILCGNNSIHLSEAVFRSPQLLHSIYGPFEAKDRYHIEDPEILDAIRYHTTGKPEMGMLSQIIFVSDYIEPHRDQALHLNELRREAFTDLDRCTYRILDDTISYLTNKGTEVASDSLEAYKYYERYK